MNKQDLVAVVADGRVCPRPKAGEGLDAVFEAIAQGR